MKRILYLISLALKLNIIKTLYFNFKFFPLKDALLLPVLLFGKINLSESTGRVNLKTVKFGTIRIGYHPHRLFGRYYCDSLTRISIKGEMILGKNVIIHNGCFIVVEEKGLFSIGDDTNIGPFSKFYCKNNIKISYCCNFSWECQIFDTDFHYIIDEKGKVVKNDKTIEIGHNCWIGNRVTINKGSKIADYSIIASNSLVNKNISRETGIFAGIPVKFIAENRRRIFDFGLEKNIDNYFEENSDREYLILSETL